MKKYILSVCLFLLFIGSSAQAQETPYLCQSDTSVFGSEAIFARYRFDTGRFTIVSWTTGEDLRELGAGLNWQDFLVVTWSSDCNTLITLSDGLTMAWNVNAGRQLSQLDVTVNSGGFYTRRRVNWSPDNRFVLLQTSHGAYLWNPTDNAHRQLNDQSDSYGRSIISGSWDLSRNQLLVVQRDTANGVTVYDLGTLEQIAFFHNGNRRQPVRFSYSGDTLFVYSGQRGWHLSYEGNPGIAVWNRQTLTGIQLDPDDPRYSLRDGFDFEQTDQYFILTARGFRSSHTVYLWDRNSLIGQEPYTSNFRRVSTPELWRIYQDGIIEFVDWKYGWYSKPSSVKIYRVQVSSGEIVAQTPWLSYSFACESGHLAEFQESMQWACENKDPKAIDYWANHEQFIWPD